MTALTPYSTKIKGNQLLINLDSTGESIQSEPAAPALLADNAADLSTEETDSATPVLAAANETPLVTAERQRTNSINGLDFRRGPLGEGRVIFDLSSAGVVTDIRQEGGRMIVEFPDTQMASNLQRRLDVMDFGTPVQFIDSISNKRGTKIIIQPASQDFEQLAYQSDNLFTVELKPMTRDEIEENRKTKFGYVGEKLSLNFQDIEVRSVLQLLADFTDLNIVVSDSVTGKLTLRLKNVPWDQALEIILQSKSLGKREAGSVIMIAPAEEIANRERIELEALKQKTELSPIRTEFFQANYAKAADLAELLQTKDGGMLTERGSVSVDERTNTLLINDTSDQLQVIRSLVHRLDVPIRQVLIESRIVIASDDFNKDIGVRWGLNRNTINPNGEADGSGFALSGNAQGVQDLINGEDVGAGRFNTNLPARSWFTGCCTGKAPVRNTARA